MIKFRIVYLLCFSALCAACGSASPSAATGSTTASSDMADDDVQAGRLTADDVYRAELLNGEFTDEVDEKRYRAIGNVLSEVNPRQRIVYFVGKLRRVPTQAKIQVLWYHNQVAEPMVVSDVYGSDTFSFVSSFTPPGPKFIPGDYTVQVTVNDRVVGTREFRVKGVDPFSAGLQVSGLKISRKLHKRTMAPIKPETRFNAASRLHASFRVKNCMSPTSLTVNWYRGGSLFSESTISVDGNGMFNANVESPDGLPNGVYTVAVEHEDMVIAETRFSVGKESFGPVIDAIALGEEPGRGTMPKQEVSQFRKGLGAVYLGLRFLDLEPNSEIQVDWVLLDGSAESVYHTVKSHVAAGGSGTMGAEWSPGEIYPGSYKVVVYINKEPAAEKEFTVQ